MDTDDNEYTDSSEELQREADVAELTIKGTTKTAPAQPNGKKKNARSKKEPLSPKRRKKGKDGKRPQEKKVKLAGPWSNISPIVVDEPLLLKKREFQQDYPLFVCQEVASRRF